MKFLKGEIPLLARTSLNFTDVRSLAIGHLQAMMHGNIGERYLLGWGESLVGRISEVARAVYPLQDAAALLSGLGELLCGLRFGGRLAFYEQPPFATRESVKMSRYPHFFSSDKADREIGYEVVGIDGAIREAVDLFQRARHGACGDNSRAGEERQAA